MDYKEQENKQNRLAVINTLMTNSKWEPTVARKEHEDEFGDVIKRGDLYYKRSCGASFTDNFRLSEKSFETLYTVIAIFNFGLTIEAAHKIAQDQERLRAAINSIDFGPKEK